MNYVSHGLSYTNASGQLLVALLRQSLRICYLTRKMAGNLSVNQPLLRHCQLQILPRTTNLAPKNYVTTQYENGYFEEAEIT